MSWKAHSFKEDENQNTKTEKENYGFKTRKYPPQCKEIENFEKDPMNIVRNIKFQENTDEFQRKLKKDIEKIKSSPKVFVPAQKTSNMYELKPEEHSKLLKENITKTYEKAPKNLDHEINFEAKKIAENIDLDDRINCLAKTQAFITLKDHKKDFRSNPRSRLINPSKSELGKISKILPEDINSELRTILELNQWKNTRSVIDWLNNIKNKQSCTFIQLDIKDFYPLAKEHIHISDDHLRIIKHCRRSLLFDKETPWIKRGPQENFDVTIGHLSKKRRRPNY